MNFTACKTQKAALLLAVFVLPYIASGQGSSYVSNLGNLWTEGGIGDIHSLGAYGGIDTARFSTGAGPLSLSLVTFELEYDSSYPAGTSSPQWINVQLFQTTGGSNLFIGSLGNPAVDPKQTQWPQSSSPNVYTAFIDFSPTRAINLTPFSQYAVVLSLQANSPVDAALMFTKSSAYTSTPGWAMGLTTSGNPFANGEFLVMAVQATAVPEPSPATLWVIAMLVVIVKCRTLHITIPLERNRR